MEVSISREYAGMSGTPLPLRASEILATYALLGMLPEPWEIRAIRALDAKFLEIASDTATAPAPKVPPVKSRER